MELIAVNSHAELLEKLKQHDKSYLLIYKSGSEQSDCAYNNLKETQSNAVVFTADVNKVRDIHKNYGVTTAPTLLEFEKERMVKAIKGCHAPEYYKGMFENNTFVAGNNEGEAKKQPRVVVYSTPTCPWCNRLKQYLKMHNIKFRDIDVSKDPKIAEELVRKSGQQGVPQTEINGKIIVGFDKPKINQLLGIQG